MKYATSTGSEMMTMKSLEIRENDFCDECPFLSYHVCEEMDKDGRVIGGYVECCHTDWCNTLWDRFKKYFERRLGK